MARRSKSTKNTDEARAALRLLVEARDRLCSGMVIAFQCIAFPGNREEREALLNLAKYLRVAFSLEPPYYMDSSEVSDGNLEIGSARYERSGTEFVLKSSRGR